MDDMSKEEKIRQLSLTLDEKIKRSKRAYS